MTAARLQTVRSVAELADVPGAREFLDSTSQLLGSPCSAILNLSLRQTIDCEEIAEVVELRDLDMERLVAHVEARFDDLVKARVVWRGGHPHCIDLKHETARGGHRFDSTVANRILAHLRRCVACHRNSQLPLPPCVLYAGLPPEHVRSDRYRWEPRTVLRTYR